MTYLRSASTSTSDTERSSALAFTCAACQSASGTRMLRSGVPLDIATGGVVRLDAEYGVSRSAIRFIGIGQSWAWLTQRESAA
jgi:hypothetical protein